MRTTWALLTATVVTATAVAVPSPAQAATLCNGRTATITGTTGNDTITGTAGIDVIAGLAGNDTISGLAGGDTICPGPGNDTVDGGEGADTFVAEATTDGADRFVGGPTGPVDGPDLVSYAARAVAISVDLNALADDGQSGEGDLVDGNSVEQVEGGFGNDVVTATFTALQYSFTGGAGSDRLTGGFALFGGAGDDVLTFPAGRPAGLLMRGNAGNDTLTSNGTGGGGNFIGDAGNDKIIAGTGSDSLFGDDGDDTLIGGPGDNFLTGGAGKDDLRGGLGNDTASGGDGDDTFTATVTVDGSDFFSGGSGSDTATYQGRANAARNTILSLTLDGLANDGEPGEGDFFATDVENVTGGTGRNIISGDGQANRLEGGPSADLIFGADGISGNDVIISHNFGNDSCTFDAGDQVSC
jgi:Ca2+-binding RTX toxin-like protein